MTTRQVAFKAPVALAIAADATTPNPGLVGVTAWSSITGNVLTWNGSNWKALAAVDNSSVQLRIARLLRAASAATGNNPRTKGAMASPPTITGSSGPASGLTNVYSACGFGGPINTAIPFTFAGGTPYINTGTGLLTFPASRVGSSSGGNLDNTGRLTNTWRVHAMTDASKVSIGINGFATYRFLIDDQYVSSVGTAAPNVGGGNAYITLDFGSSKTTGRKISVEGQAGGTGFFNFSVGPTDSVWKTDQTDEPKIVVVGDSICAGTGATFQNDSWANCLGDYLGTDNLWNMGQGGTGYTVDGSSWRYSSHSTDWTSQTDTDLLVFSGGNNDSSIAPATVQAAALALFQLSRTSLPYTPIVVFGPDNSSTGPSSQILATEAAIKAAVDSMGDPMIVFIPIANTSEGKPELFGTGYPGATNGTGNADIYSGADSTHPQEAGHLYRGKRRAERAKAALQTMALGSATKSNLSLYGSATCNFGTVPISAKTFSISAPGATPTRGVYAYHVPASDEGEMDGFALSASCLVADTIQIYAQALPGPVTGSRVFNFTII